MDKMIMKQETCDGGVRRRCDKCSQWHDADFSFFTETMWFCHACKVQDAARQFEEHYKDIRINVKVSKNVPADSIILTMENISIPYGKVVEVGGPVHKNASLTRTLLDLVEKVK